MQAQVLFDFGRGPRRRRDHMTYRYWVAVTDRNKAVIDKQYFDLPVTFPAGQDRVPVTEDIHGITIPRANADVSGANFEVLVGFDVTPRDGRLQPRGQALPRQRRRHRRQASAAGAAGPRQ